MSVGYVNINETLSIDKVEKMVKYVNSNIEKTTSFEKFLELLMEKVSLLKIKADMVKANMVIGKPDQIKSIITISEKELSKIDTEIKQIRELIALTNGVIYK